MVLIELFLSPVFNREMSEAIWSWVRRLEGKYVKQICLLKTKKHRVNGASSQGWSLALTRFSISKKTIFLT